jgi:hypothetical protein
MFELSSPVIFEYPGKSNIFEKEIPCIECSQDSLRAQHVARTVGDNRADMTLVNRLTHDTAPLDSADTDSPTSCLILVGASIPIVEDSPSFFYPGRV